MARAFELKIPPTPKLVLLALTDHARDDGTGAYPSIETLARKTSLGERGVQKVMRLLETWGFIAPTAHVKGGRGFATEYRITLEKGEPQDTLFAKKGEPQDRKGRTTVPKRVNVETEKGEPGFTPIIREPEERIIREPVAARVLDAEYIERLPEKAVQQPLLLTELTNKKENHHPPWVKGQLAEDLYRGIHGQKIAHAFFDARLLKPCEQIAACVSVAVTSLVTARVATLKALRADEIEKAAVEELLGGLATLALIQDFEARRWHTVQAVTRVVIAVTARMLQERHGLDRHID